MSEISHNPHLRQEPSELSNSYLDFMLARQAMLVTDQTLVFYRKTLGKVIEWLTEQGVEAPAEITARHIRRFLAEQKARGCSDSYIHTFARAARTYLRFLEAEGYRDDVVTFDMPRIGEKRLPVLTIEEVKILIKACGNVRDRAIILFLVDTGLRRAELCALNWGEIDLATGHCLVRRGKGKKARTVVLGAKTRRMLLRYRAKVTSAPDRPIFQTVEGERLSPGGLRSLFVRLAGKTGIHVTPHALRRTFVVMALRAGMSLAHVQALMGHSTPTMTLAYARLVDEDLLSAHQEHGPVDRFIR